MRKYVVSTYKGSQETSPHGQVGGNYLCEDAAVFVFNNTEKSFEVKSMFKDFRVQPFAHATEVNGFNRNGEYKIVAFSVSFSANYLNLPSYLIPFL